MSCSIRCNILTSSACCSGFFKHRPPSWFSDEAFKDPIYLHMISGWTALTNAPGCFLPRALVMPHSWMVCSSVSALFYISKSFYRSRQALLEQYLLPPPLQSVKNAYRLCDADCGGQEVLSLDDRTALQRLERVSLKLQ